MVTKAEVSLKGFINIEDKYGKYRIEMDGAIKVQFWEYLQGVKLMINVGKIKAMRCNSSNGNESFKDFGLIPYGAIWLWVREELQVPWLNNFNI